MAISRQWLDHYVSTTLQGRGACAELCCIWAVAMTIRIPRASTGTPVPLRSEARGRPYSMMAVEWICILSILHTMLVRVNHLII